MFLINCLSDYEDEIARLRTNLGFFQKWVGDFARELGHKSRVFLVAFAIGVLDDVIRVLIMGCFCSIPDDEEEVFVVVSLEGDDTDDLAKEIWNLV